MDDGIQALLRTLEGYTGWPLSRFGGTDFCSACFTAIGEIAKRPEKRKVILVMTDGDVGQISLVASIQKTAVAHGIEARVVFLCINPDAARCMATAGRFARHGVANQAEEVPKAVFAALEDIFRVVTAPRLASSQRRFFFVELGCKTHGRRIDSLPFRCQSGFSYHTGFDLLIMVMSNLNSGDNHLG